MGFYMEIFEARVLGENLSFWYELQISKKKIHIEISFSPTFLKQKKTSYQYKFLLKL
jgi:hypothetical protein